MSPATAQKGGPREGVSLLELRLKVQCKRCGCSGRHESWQDCIRALRCENESLRGCIGERQLEQDPYEGTVNGHVFRDLNNYKREALEHRILTTNLIARLARHEDVSGIQLPVEQTPSRRELDRQRAADVVEQPSLFS